MLIDQLNFKGYTPLFYAVKSGSLSVMLELIENGADVNHKHVRQNKTCGESEYRIDNKTPLFRARSYEVVKLLLQKGAKPNLSATIKYKKDGREKEKRVRAIDHLMKFNPDAARAIFDKCLDIDKENNLIMDFEIFDRHDKNG